MSKPPTHQKVPKIIVKLIFEKIVSTVKCPVTISSCVINSTLKYISINAMGHILNSLFLAFSCLGAEIISAGLVAVEIRATASQGRVES